MMRGAGKTMRTRLGRLWRDLSGVSALEFALILPILSGLTAGTIEYGRMILLSQKLQNGTFNHADHAARDKTLSEEQLDSIFLALNNIIQPFEFENSGAAVVSGITIDASGDPVISWQRSGFGALAEASRIGTVGNEADLPAVLTFVAGETLIVAEVFYDFQPIFGLTTGPHVLHKVSYVKPRLGTLASLAP
jgi:Flp pilus assembly protein TadG